MVIAAIADTHIGDRLAALPISLCNLLDRKKPDYILHSGDVTESSVLAQLNEIAPTIAVCGDHDRIPELRPVEYIFIKGQTIVLTHGDRPHSKEAPSIYANKLFAKLGIHFRWWNGFFREVYQAFAPTLPDCIVHGHLHRPSIECMGRTLIVCPGAVCMNSRMPQSKLVPSIAFLTVDLRTIKAEIVPSISRPEFVPTPAFAPAFRRNYAGVVI